MNIKTIWKSFFFGMIAAVLFLAIFTIIFIHTDLNEKIFEKIAPILLFGIICFSSMFTTLRASQKRLFHGLSVALLWLILFVVFNALFQLNADIFLKLIICLTAGVFGSLVGVFFS